MTTSPVTLPDAIRNAILYQLNLIHTAMPGQIIDYDYTVQKASIQPTINKSWTNGTSTSMPVLQNVPVIFPQSGGASLTFPVNVGDPCLVVCCERSIDEWLNSGGLVKPTDPRKLDLSDAVAIMGLMPFNSSFPPRINNTDLVLNFSGASIIITPTGDISITNSAGSVISLTATGGIKLNTATTLALGTPTNELINQLNTFFQVLVADPEFTGTFLPTTVVALNTLIANLTALDGTLP